MQFTRLKLTGFKSFVEPTELLIEPGLTGVVGPNGCGKSNLVEALRWVMGETSARQMRGGEMDDVIFGGTSNRPARNLAEVLLAINNPDRRAPAAFNDLDDINVIRRIERGEGSTYRVNGKEVRARDVQLLFADAATGAHSPSLVSQGRVGILINAKPTDRRAILEDAAGIAGLHSRRHEAELRLKAADANLARLEDVLGGFDRQLDGLKRQARQAERYRLLTEQIKKSEAIMLALRWQKATAARAELAGELRRADTAVAEAGELVAIATSKQANVAADLPGLRQAEVAAAAELQRLTLAAAELDAEERRTGDAARALEARLADFERDKQREGQLAADAAAAIDRLEKEAAQIEAARSGEGEAADQAKAELVVAEKAAEVAEQAWNTAAQAIAADRARATALETRTRDLDGRRQRLARSRADLDQQRARLAQEQAGLPTIDTAKAAEQAADTAVTEAARALDAAGSKRSAARTAESEATSALQTGEGERAKLRGELAGIAASLADRPAKPGAGPALPPVIDQVTVEKGFEAAFAAALGDDLSAPLGAGGDEPVRWDAFGEITDLPPLPDDATALIDRVDAPAALANRLRQTGIVINKDTGARLQPLLRPGQRLVSVTGDLWRWDGFVRRSGAPSAAAVRLTQRNRKAEIEKQLEAVEATIREKVAAADAARTALRAAESEEIAARNAERVASQALTRAREERGRVEARVQALAGRLASLDEQTTRLSAEEAEVEKAATELAAERAALPDAAAAEARVNALRNELNEKRQAVVAARSVVDRLARESGDRARRSAAIANERNDWQKRAGGTVQRLTEIEERRVQAEAERTKLAAVPDQLATKRATVLDLTGQAEAKRKAAADRLAEAEARLAEVDRAVRAADQTLAAAREARILANSKVEQAVAEATAIAERIRERLACRPDEVAELAGLDDPEAPPAPSIDKAQADFERAMRDRDALGPVNLRAEEEANEIDTQSAGLRAERDDLVEAIHRLRGGIAQLNREGRERLLASFTQVKAHFEDLFVRLFGGGRAELQLTESDDPLAAGLEILASPPGKKLQVLSLFSGGEQALTALALIFAVFLTNPSPICVLDEVDAPLDDVNVDRFCALLGDIAGTTGTRFLVVTHHRMTMARMDRLFGVTMAERGISQLVSVDLAEAERVVGAA